MAVCLGGWVENQGVASSLEPKWQHNDIPPPPMLVVLIARDRITSFCDCLVRVLVLELVLVLVLVLVPVLALVLVRVLVLE